MNTSRRLFFLCVAALLGTRAEAVSMRAIFGPNGPLGNNFHGTNNVVASNAPSDSIYTPYKPVIQNAPAVEVPVIEVLAEQQVPVAEQIIQNSPVDTGATSGQTSSQQELTPEVKSYLQSCKNFGYKVFEVAKGHRYSTAGIVAVVIIGGVEIFVYKNEHVKQVAEKIKNAAKQTASFVNNHKKAVAGAVTGVAATAGVYAAYAKGVFGTVASKMPAMSIPTMETVKSYVPSMATLKSYVPSSMPAMQRPTMETLKSSMTAKNAGIVAGVAVVGAAGYYGKKYLDAIFAFMPNEVAEEVVTKQQLPSISPTEVPGIGQISGDKKQQLVKTVVEAAKQELNSFLSNPRTLCNQQTVNAILAKGGITGFETDTFVQLVVNARRGGQSARAKANQMIEEIK